MAENQRQYCLTLNLRDDDDLVREYEEYHRPGGVWPEIVDSIRDAGILDMQIYRSGLLLIMVLTVSNSFSFDKKASMDRDNPKVVEWECLMTRFQNSDSDGAGGKWQSITNIFNLQEHKGTA